MRPLTHPTLPLVAVCLLAPAQAATAAQPQPQPASAAAGAPPIVVGSVASLTGSGAPYGLDQARGSRLAVAVLNRRRPPGAPRLVLRGADDRSREDAAKAAFERLVGLPVAALVGPTLSPAAAVADPVAVAAGVPVLAATNTTLDIDRLRTVWRVSLSERAMIPQAVAAARKRFGIERAALLVDSGDGYSTGAAEVFESATARAGIALTGRAGFGEADVDAAVAALRAGNPQAVFVAARSSAAVAALKAIRRVDGAIPVVGGNGFNSDEVIAAAGPATDGAIVAASWNAGISHPRSRAFVRAYRKRFGTAPSAFAAQGYASVEVAAAAARAGGGAGPARMLRGLRRLGRIETALGSLRFSKRREAVYPAAVQIVRGGRFALLPQPVSILGSWSGRLTQAGMPPFRVWATIDSLSSTAGNRVRYSGLDCRGRWTPLAQRGPTYRFRERITAGTSDACKGVGTVTLAPTKNPNALRFTFTGGGVTSTGTLRRQASPDGL